MPIKEADKSYDHKKIEKKDSKLLGRRRYFF